MAITRKPIRSADDASKSPVDVEALINRGGSVAVAEPVDTLPPSTRTTATVNLRIPTELVEKIDTSLEARPVKTPRHTWLMEAVVEKLERENKE